ncbi:voltage-dependent anion-selective channel-like [Leptinotarsa decemlineata]|uniref:voltage-dependent anion-selective channel-like n=1 Tax=Leptinotarsa decemlineata TaxID=7539 RepID=UPI003D305773
MSPPPYSDFGKRAKDVFNKGCHYGLIKLDCKTKDCGGVEVNTVGTSNQESGKVSGSSETKYKIKDLTFTEKWNTDTQHNKVFVSGLKLDDFNVFPRVKTESDHKNYQFCFGIEDGQEFGGSIYRKISPKLDHGIQLA